VTIVYQGLNSKFWSRRADDWHRSMIVVPDYMPGPEFFAALRDKAHEAMSGFGLRFREDLRSARQIALAAIEVYGNLDKEKHVRFIEHGMWDDHPAVQAVLAAIRLSRK